jgi:hypothetical protein
LQLHLSDFAYEEVVQEDLGDQNRQIHISGQQLCQFLAAAEEIVQKAKIVKGRLLPPGIRKRRRSDTPPDKVTLSDQAKEEEHERKVARRIEAQDPDYKDSV